MNHTLNAEPVKKSVIHSTAFKLRGFWGGMLLVPTCIAVLLSKPLITHDTPADHVLEIVGCGFFLLYAFIRIWATMYIGDRKERELVTEGPYSLCRNPLYVGSFCAAIAIACFLHSFLLLVATLFAAVFYYRFVIPNEEAVLAHRYGEAFEQYQRTTPRILPRLGGYRSPSSIVVKLAGMRREIKRLSCSTVLFIAALALCHLRGLPWWPHLFVLP